MDKNSLDDKFVLTNGDFIKDRELDSMAYTRLERVSQKLFGLSRGGNEVNLGFPKAVEMIPNRCVIIGTNTSYLCVFGWDESRPQVLGGPTEQNYGPIVSLDVSQDGEMVISAHECGQMVLWDIKRFKLIKTILNVHSSPVLQVKFYNKWGFLSADLKGNLYKVDIFRSFFSYSVDKQLLIRTNKYVFHSMCLLGEGQKSGQDLDGFTLVALMSTESILILKLEPTFEKLHEIKKYPWVGQCQLPSVSWGRMVWEDTLTTVLAIGWGNTLQVVKFNTGVPGDDPKETYPSLCYYYSDYDILFTSFLSDQFVLLLDSRKNIKVLQTAYFLPMGEEGPSN